MSAFEVLGVVLLAGIVWLWLDGFKAREAAIRAARAACASEGLQLLDDTVAIASLSLGRNDNGRIMLRRTYHFEFSETGDNRRRGSLILLGHRVIVVNIGLRLLPAQRTLH